MVDPSRIDACVYGPVPSRRLGRSLGVDLVPFKTCTYDCIYCQLGRTTHKTARRQRWIDPAAVVAAVRDRLESRPDVIALAGSGEPTLDERIGEVIRGIKRLTTTPVAVITNGSLLGRPDVRRDLAAADIVLPSLDAPTAGLFALVNRPHRALRHTELVDGLIAFREEYRGELWLEILLVGGVTGIASEVRRLAQIAARVGPDRIHLTTVVRPPAEDHVEPVTASALQNFAPLFRPAAEVVAAPGPAPGDAIVGETEILALLSRRPCTIDDIASGLHVHRNEALKAASALVQTRSVVKVTHEGRTFFTVAPDSSRSTTREDS